MPLYDVKCTTCGKASDFYTSIVNRDLTPICCDSPMIRMIAAPRVAVFTPFLSPVDGKMIDDKTQLRAMKKRHGLTEVGTEKLETKPSVGYSTKGLKEEIAKHLYK